MTIPKISQAASAAAERYFAMRRNAPDHADRSLAEIIEGAIHQQASRMIHEVLTISPPFPSRGCEVTHLSIADAIGKE